MYIPRLLIIVFAVMSYSVISNAQNRTISGVVSSNGNPLDKIKITVKDYIRDSVDRNIMQPTSREVEILPVAFGENAALMGAFALILNRVLNMDIIKNVWMEPGSDYKEKLFAERRRTTLHNRLK